MSQTASSHRLYEKKKREFTKSLKAANFSQVEGNKYSCVHCQFEFNYRIETAVRHLENCENFRGKKTNAFLFLVEHYLNVSCPPSVVENQNVLDVLERIPAPQGRRWTPTEIQEYKLDVVNMVVSGNVPFEFVNNYYLKKLICHGDVQRTANYPSKREVRHNLLDERLAEVEAAIEESFKVKYTAAVSLVCDSWTSISRSHLMGVILSRRGLKETDYPVNIPITFSNDTAVNNAKFLEKIILDLNQRFGVTINNLVTDDASQLRKARGILGKRHPCILMCHCLAHQINLIVGKVLKKCGYPTLERAKALVSAYHNSSSHLKTLTECCINKYGPGKGIALKKMTKIRWNSAYFMLASILRIRGALLTLAQVLPEKNSNVSEALLIDDSFISECLRLVKILRPLSFASLKMQRESENMSDLVGCFLELHDSLLGIPDEVSKKELLDDLDKRWIDYEHPVLILAFCLDPVTSVIYRKMHNILREKYGLTHLRLGYCARKYVKKYLGGFKEVKYTMLVELGRWLGEAGNGLVDAFKKEQRISSSRMNSWDFWEFAEFDFPNLSPLGKFLATSKVSSATCERLFSIYGRIKTKGRCNLKDDALSDMGVLKPYLKREIQEKTGKVPREKNRKLLDYQEHSLLFTRTNPDFAVNQTEDEIGGSDSEVSDNENEGIVEGDVEEDWEELFSCAEDLSTTHEHEAINQLELIEVSAEAYECSFEEDGHLAPEVFTGESYRCSAGEISSGSEIDNLEPWRSYKIPLEHLSRIWKLSISSNSAQLAQPVSDDISSGDSSTTGTKRKHNSE